MSATPWDIKNLSKPDAIRLDRQTLARRSSQFAMPLRPLGISLRLFTLVLLVVPPLVCANLISVDLPGNTDGDVNLQDIADLVNLGVNVDDGGLSLTLDLPSDIGPPEPAASKQVVARSMYSCPPKDKHGNTLGFRSQSSSPMRCMYKRQDRDRGSYCLYDKVSSPTPQ